MHYACPDLCYGHPADPAAFDAYYTSTQVPLAEKIPGMTSYTYRHCASLDGSQPPYYLLAELSFPSQEAMGTALTSPEPRRPPLTCRTSPPAASPCSSPATEPAARADQRKQAARPDGRAARLGVPS